MADVDIFQHQGFGTSLGYGRKTALLVIDLQLCFTTQDELGGFNMADAIDGTAGLLRTARQVSLPVAHVRFLAQAAPGGAGVFGDKVPALHALTRDNPRTAFVPSVAPIDGEYVLEKEHASAFFGTPLSSWARVNGIDTLLIAGCTTSGCVRASVVDASAHGIRPIVVDGCVGDRAEGPHRSSLFDMAQKYADVLPLADVRADLERDKAA